MALVIDGFKVLRRIGKSPDVFVDVGADASKAAHTFVAKQLKAKSTDVKALRKICSALGEDSFNLIIESLKDPAIKALIAKIDKSNPQIKAADTTWRRKHVLALAVGRADPAAKSVKKGKKVRTPEPRLSNDVFDALKQRR